MPAIVDKFFLMGVDPKNPPPQGFLNCLSQESPLIGPKDPRG